MDSFRVFPWRESAALVSLGQQIVEFVVVAGLLYLLGRILVAPVANWLLEVREVERTIAAGLRKGVRTGIPVVAVIVAAEFAGFTRLIGGSALLAAAATVALGFAAQDIIANLAAGVFIVYDRQFNIGDWIEWNENVGVIDEITFRATRVRTFDNELVTVPNTALATSEVTNRMSNDTLRVTAVFGIEYGADLEEARDILLDIARGHPDVLAEPGPSVQVRELAGDSIDLEARFWIADPTRRDYLTVRSAFLQQAVERLHAANVEVGTITDVDIGGELAVASAGG